MDHTNSNSFLYIDHAINYRFLTCKLLISANLLYTDLIGLGYTSTWSFYYDILLPEANIIFMWPKYMLTIHACSGYMYVYMVWIYNMFSLYVCIYGLNI